MEKLPVLFCNLASETYGETEDESWNRIPSGIYVEMEKEDLTIIKKLIKKYTKQQKTHDPDYVILSEIKDKVARSWIELHLSKEQAKTNGDYSRLQNQLGKTLDSFKRYEKKLAYMNLLVKLFIMLEEYREDEADTLFIDVEKENELWDDSRVWNCEYVDIDFLSLFGEWERLEGPRLLSEAQLSELDNHAQITELEWWQNDSNWTWIEDADSDDLTVVFRAIRNSLLKSIRLGEPVLASEKWIERIEII